MKKGDRIIITSTNSFYFNVGETAILTDRDPEGNWWATFDKDWKERRLQSNWVEYELVYND